MFERDDGDDEGIDDDDDDDEDNDQELLRRWRHQWCFVSLSPPATMKSTIAQVGRRS